VQAMLPEARLVYLTRPSAHCAAACQLVHGVGRRVQPQACMPSAIAPLGPGPAPAGPWRSLATCPAQRAMADAFQPAPRW